MLRSVFISIIFMLPIACISYKLFKYYFRNRGFVSTATSDSQSRKWKINLSIIGAVICIALAMLWLAIVWVPDNQLPFIVKLLFYILLLPFVLALVISFAFINSLGSAVEAGGGSTRSIIKGAADVFKDEPLKMDEKVDAKHIESVQNEVAKKNAIELNDDLKEKETIQRWRLAAAILSGLVILCIVAFNRPRLFSGFFPWVYYIFGPLLIAAVIVVITARTKERKLNDQSETRSAEAIARATRAKYSLLILLVLVIIFIGCIIWDSDYGYAYRQYFFHSKDELHLDFNRLEPINMSDANKTFKLNWFCRKEQTQFGDFSCADELLKWNNMPAMTVIFWYRDGILTYAKIDVPRWCHDELIKYIHAIYGPPHSYSARANLRNILAGTSAIIRGSRGNTIITEVNDLGVWQMDTGAFLVINLKKELNPLLWNTVFWISPTIVKDGEKKLNQKKLK